MVVAQLAERSLPTPEIRGSNLDIGIISIVKFICQLLSRKDKNKEKEAGKGPLKKKSGGLHTILASHPAVLGLIIGIPKNFSLDVAEIY